MKLLRPLRKSQTRGGRMSAVAMIVGLCFVFLLAACDENLFESGSDDDSYQARIDDAEIALDDGDFSKARRILLDLKEDYPNREKVCELLSNALAGLAGFDTFHWLETIDDLEETGETGSIDMIGRIIGDENNRLTSNEVATKLDYIDQAIYGDPSTEGFIDCIPEPDNAQTTQLGLLSVVHSALTIADLVMVDLNTSVITLTEEGLNSLYATSPADFSDVDDNYLIKTNDKLNDNLDRILAAVAALDETQPDNDITDSFFEFVEDLDPDSDGLDAAGGDLAAYINNL